MNLSLDTAVAITRWSRRTWWRRIGEGSVKRVANDARGRAMLGWDDVSSHLLIDLSAEDRAVLQRADEDIAEAQNDIGLLFLESGYEQAGLFWIRRAAENGFPDAMQCLGHAYAAGNGVERDENLAIMWIAKAAACGHPIAQSQMCSLRSHERSR